MTTNVGCFGRDVRLSPPRRLRSSVRARSAIAPGRAGSGTQLPPGLSPVRSMPDDFVWSMDKAAVDTLQAQRLTVLRAMYEASRADVAADVDYAAATMGLDLPADDIGRILRYWEDRGMLRLRHASVTITGRGIDFIEEEIRLTD